MNVQGALVRRAWNAAWVVLLLCSVSATTYAGGLEVSSNVLNFGMCQAGTTSASETVTLTNTGRQKINLVSVSITSLQFVYSGPAMPITLGPGQGFSGHVNFLPTTAQFYSGELIFRRANGTGVTIKMSGTGTAAASAPTPTPTPVTPTISWPAPAPITYGTPLSATQLDATASTSGSFSYSPALGTVLNAGSQTLSVTFTPTDTTNYTASTASIVLTVNRAITTISWPSPAAITYGTALSAAQLDATANTAGSFSYSPALGAVLGAGKQTLSMTFTPSNPNYTATTGSVVLIVNQAAPTITWATPAAITSGTGLSATQLDATANTAGTFIYSPAAGTVLAAGNHTLSVTFTPTDANDYSPAVDSVTLTVNSSTPATGTLSVTPTAVSLGNVNVGSNASQTVTVTNSGSASVTISSIGLSGSGVGASGVSNGMVLSGGQSASLDVTFTAYGTGSLSGTVTISSNASDSTLTIPVSATGLSNSVLLSWNADSSATAGYNVYSSTVSGGPYNLLTASPVLSPSYTDNTVQPGLTYFYVVTAVNAAGQQSGYSNQASAVIP